MRTASQTRQMFQRGGTEEALQGLLFATKTGLVDSPRWQRETLDQTKNDRMLGHRTAAIGTRVEQHSYYFLCSLSCGITWMSLLNTVDIGYNEHQVEISKIHYY